MGTLPKKIDDIFGLDDVDIGGLTAAELKKIVQKAGKFINQRYNRTKKSLGETAATRGLENSGGKISTRGKNLNALRREFYRARNYYTAKTGTVTGAKSVQRAFEKRLGLKHLTPEQTAKFWSLYNKLTELHPEILSARGGSTRLQQAVANVIERGDNIDLLLEQIENDLRSEYEREYEDNGDDYTDIEL